MKKKVLIVNGHSIHENNSTSITLKSIISSFDKNDLLEVYYYPIKNLNGQKYLINSIQLKSETKWFYSLISKYFTGRLRNEINNKMLISEIENKSSIFHKLKNFLLAFNDYLPINMKCNKPEIERVDQFRPDIIYTLGSAIFPLEVSLFFANKYKIPIVLHHMDNWRETKYYEAYLPKCFKNKLQEILVRVEKDMKYGMTISEEMAEYYKKFHKDYIALMNTVPKFDINSPSFTKNEFQLVYAGGLHLNRWKVLLDFERVIKKITKEDKKITLHIFTKQIDRSKYENIFDKETTIFHDFLPHNQVYQIYEMADILIHMESFEMNIKKFIKYSLSTKIPEYMSAGRPIICYAPKEIAVSKYILKSKCGLSASNIDELYDSLNLLLNDDFLRKRMSQNGIKTASEKHSDKYKNQIIKKVFNC